MKRTPLKRKKPMRRTAMKRSKVEHWDIANPNYVAKFRVIKPMKRYRKDSATARADKLWAQSIHARGVCAVCGHHGDDFSGRLEAHHARGRSKRYRWRTETALLLCARHHRTNTRPSMSAHGTPLKFAEWLNTNHPEILTAEYEIETASDAIKRLLA